MNKVIIISGPTATGKTRISIELAAKFNGVIVNFDSLLFYKELQISTARPTVEEQRGIPHYLLGTESISSPINAADFVKKAQPLIKDLHAQGKLVFLVGGSGFYLRALTQGMYDSLTTPEAIVQKSQKLYEQENIAPFLALLEQHDPESFKKLHPNDHYRIRRAVEHWWTTGVAFSSAQKQHEKNATAPSWDVLHCYLDIPKEEHRSLIEKRTQIMLQQGMIEEIQFLLKQGFTGEEKPLQSVGPKEVQEYLRGEIKTLEELKEKICISTAQLAKAQRTWFNKIEHKSIFNPLAEVSSLNSLMTSFIN